MRKKQLKVKKEFFLINLNKAKHNQSITKQFTYYVLIQYKFLDTFLSKTKIPIRFILLLKCKFMNAHLRYIILNLMNEKNH